MEKDFYEILGLTEEDKELSGKEFDKVLKEKYKKLAVKWHPDKFSTKSDEEKKEAEEKFKEISEAYNTLSDESKRQEYDMQNGDFSGFNPFGEGFDPFGMFSSRRRGPSKADSIGIKISVTLKDLYKGFERDVEYDRYVPCHHCNGTGSEDGKKATCPHCHGSGFISQISRHGNMQTIQSSPCPYCHGTGIKIETPCHECGGRGVEAQKTNQHIVISPGTLPGRKLKIDGAGEIKEGFIPGDLIITLVKDSNDKYEMNNQGDVIEVIEVPFIDAILGTNITVEFLSGNKETLKLKELTPDGFTYTYYNKGFPLYGVGLNGNSSHIVKVKYKYPDKLTSKQRELLKKVNK